MTEAPDPNVRPFSTFLLEQARGRSHDDLSATLHKLIQEVRDTGKKGSLTYTVTISPLDKEVRSFSVVDEIKTKYPEHDRPTSIFYPDADGNLSRRDPNQMSFDDLPTLSDPVGLDRVTGEIPMENTQ